MVFKINGIPAGVLNALNEDGFAEWLDNCFHRRSIYMSPYVSIPLGIHHTSAQKIEAVLPHFFAATHPTDFKYMSLENAIEDLKKCFDLSKVPLGELEWINQVDLRVVACVRHSLILGNDLLAPKFGQSNIIDSPIYKQLLKVEEILRIVHPLASSTFTSSTSNQPPRNDKELRHSLKHFFQNWEAPLIAKKPWIDKFREVQTAIEPFEKSFKWLDVKNAKQIDWAFEYVTKRLPYYPSFQMFDVNLKRIATILSFDYWFVSWADKELFLIKMKKAWTVKKFRDKNKHKKSFNFLLDSSMEKKLDELVSRTGKTKNELIELCVKEAHRHTPKPGSKIDAPNGVDQTLILGEP